MILRLLTYIEHTGYVWSIAFSPDGKTIASGSYDSAIRLWDVDTGKEKRMLRGHRGYIISIAFSPDGKTLASAGWDNTISLWDVDKGEQREYSKDIPQLSQA